MGSFTTKEIARVVSGELQGPGDLVIEGVDQLEAAGLQQVTFIRDNRHAAQWAGRSAGAALVTRGVKIDAVPGRALIFVADADVALAQVLEMFAPPPVRPAPGIHPRATVDPTAILGRDLFISAGVFIGPGVKVGDGCVIHANVSILDHSTIGPRCELFPGVVIRERCELGGDCILHPNAVIGADGFGYRAAPDGRGVVKVPQIGTVRLGNRVEIGAATCIDRAKFSETVIGDDTKIDNLCHIAHNCRIGRACLITAQAAIAGSVTIGDGVQTGGNVMIRDHVTIGNGVRLAGGAAVVNDIPDGESWAGYPAHNAVAALREFAAMRKLPDLVRQLRKPGKP